MGIKKELQPAILLEEVVMTKGLKSKKHMHAPIKCETSKIIESTNRVKARRL